MVRFQIPTVLRGKKKKRVKHKGRFTIKTTIKIFDKKLDHSLFKIKNESIVFKTNTDNTLGKLHRISKIPLLPFQKAFPIYVHKRISIVNLKKVLKTLL